MNWHLLIDESALAALLPRKYAPFARPVRDALSLFLEGLPARHQQEIVARQTALPNNATFSTRLCVLAQCCPVLHKLGQVLARDQRLAAELREQLRSLESLPATVPWTAIESTVRDELGAAAEQDVVLERPALAEASVAVVVGYRRKSERAGAGEPFSAGTGAATRGVLKILKPGIRERLDLELALLEGVGVHLDERCAELGIPHLDYQESFQRVREKLCDEVRLDQEQRHLRQAAEFYAGDAEVQIPRLFPECTPRITAMERVTGGKVTDRVRCGTVAGRAVAESLVASLIARPIFSGASAAMFHGDPHAGNLFYTADGRLAVLDWSLAGRLGQRERELIVQILLAGVTLQPDRMVELFDGLAERPGGDRGALREVAGRAVRRIRQGQLPGFSWLVETLDAAVQQARLRVDAEMMLFRKSLHTLAGVAADVGGREFQLDHVMLREFITHFAREWPSRWWARPDSRQFTTRLSNWDLVRTWLNTPATFARFWAGQGADLLTGFRESFPLRS